MIIKVFAVCYYSLTRFCLKVVTTQQEHIAAQFAAQVAAAATESLDRIKPAVSFIFIQSAVHSFNIVL